MTAPGFSPEFDPQRRAFLRGRSKDVDRPPWTDSRRLATSCTQCGACIAACPEAILLADLAGFPMLDFSRGGCSFCAACVDACAEAVFRPRQEAPWHKLAVINKRCLAGQGIVCQSCKDACEAGAIHFSRQVGQVPQPRIVAESCTGCGACQAPCPGAAISIQVGVMPPADEARHVAR